MTDLTKYLGLRHRLKGRDRSGIDCWGLSRLYLSEVHGLVDLPWYNETSDIKTAIAEAMAGDDWNQITAPRDGDVMVMFTPTISGAVAPLHVGVMVSSSRVLNIDEGMSSVVVPIEHPDIASRFHSFWRHVRLAEKAS